MCLSPRRLSTQKSQHQKLGSACFMFTTSWLAPILQSPKLPSAKAMSLPPPSPAQQDLESNSKSKIRKTHGLCVFSGLYSPKSKIPLLALVYLFSRLLASKGSKTKTAKATIMFTGSSLATIFQSPKKPVQRGYVSPLASSRLRRPKLKIEVLTFNVLCVLLAEIFENLETHVQKAYRSVCLFEKIQILSLCILLPLSISERNSRSLHSKALCLPPLSVRLKSQKYEYPTSLITSGLSNLTLLIFRTQRKTLLWRCVSVQKATPPSLWSLPRFPLSQ
jgi:hypothetical protein